MVGQLCTLSALSVFGVFLNLQIIIFLLLSGLLER